MPRTREFAVFLDPETQNVEISGTVEYTVTPGEPMVWRYPDGSGYPGSPATVEFWGPRVKSVTLSIGDLLLEFDLDELSPPERKRLNDVAWGLMDEDTETDSVLERESELATDGRDHDDD